MTFTEEAKCLDAYEMGKRIRKLRKELGIKAIDMAFMLDMTKSTYSRVENGWTVCSIDRIYRLAQYLNTSVDYLMTGERWSPSVMHIANFLDGCSDKELNKVKKLLDITFS